MPRLRILITGAGGFVGGHLISSLRAQFIDAEICATAPRIRQELDGEQFRLLDITDAVDVKAVIGEFQPTHIVHLAALTTLASASLNYQATWHLHLFGTLNIANAILEFAPGCTLLFVGSGEVYGASARSAISLDETAPLAPMNEYAATKAAADLALGAMAQKGLRSIRLRPFNHTGPGQSNKFVIPSFAEQIVAIEQGVIPPVLKVGNLEAERDFLDVRDVVDAYAAAIAMSADLQPGVILNIASGIPVRMRELLDRLLALSASSSIRIEQDVARMRVNDIPRYVGDASRVRQLLGWSPRVPLDDMLRGILDYFRGSDVSAAGLKVGDLPVKPHN